MSNIEIKKSEKLQNYESSIDFMKSRVLQIKNNKQSDIIV